MERDGKINLSMFSAICFCSSEAQEVLNAATYLNENSTTEELKDSDGNQVPD